MALLPATTFPGMSPCARHLVSLLEGDDVHGTLPVWLGTQICSERPYPDHSRPIALFSSRYFRVRSQGQSSVLVMVADYIPV